MTEDKDPLIGSAPLTDEGCYTDSNGYYRRRKDKRLVHRVRYFEAYPKMNPYWQVHHINGDKKDNRIENLIALQPRVHKRLHESFPMRALPTREEILLWLQSGKKRKVVRDARVTRKPKHQRGMTRFFFQKGTKPNFRPAMIDKPFTAKVVVRKGGKKTTSKRVPVATFTELGTARLLKCFGRRKKRKLPVVAEILKTPEQEFIDVRWQLWESKD